MGHSRANDTDPSEGAGDASNGAEAAIEHVTPPMPGTAPTKWNTLVMGRKFALAFRQGRGNDAFFVSRGLRKPVAEFPLSEEGWHLAWGEFSSLEPRRAMEYEVELQERAAAQGFIEALPSGLAFLSLCTYLGGYGTPLSPGTSCEILCDDTAFDVLVVRESVHRVDYEKVREIEISGRGLLKSGGGFIGGGFGAAGIVEGMGIAVLLNALTTRTAMETLLRLNCADQELFFHSARLTPANLRIQLSGVIARTPAGQSKVNVVDRPATADEPLDRLERLASLFREGLLSAEEFEAGKRSILGLGH